MRTGWRTELPLLVLVVAMFAAGARAWRLVPGRVAVHWDLSGRPDGYGGRFEGLFLLPLITLGVYVLMRFLPRIDPLRESYEAFGGVYLVFRYAVVILLTLVYGFMLAWDLGYELSLSRAITVVLGMLFVVLGNFLGKVRPNWFVGIRTPWTLSSRRSWVRTHRLGGWLFVLAGLALMGMGLVYPAAGAVAIGPTVLVCVAVPLVYSYRVWKADPDRDPPVWKRPPRGD
ncbi:SdpI family protein [Rubrobacter naiadicus]|uniref:SdpI family protein n=1 Tax=Rubrobacter naiadicus TaxID=1392641 RepID=UPI00235F809A|nr:SdpI family protein [Rubrobacter naiadicus]